MAVKAVGWIEKPDPNTNDTYRFYLSIFSGVNSSVNVVNDEYFANDAVPATVNASLNAFIQSYAETTWEVEFGMTDSAMLLNPISTI